MLAHIITYIRIKTNKEEEKRVKEKYGIASKTALKLLEKYKQSCKENNVKTKIVWLHAVSVGESLSVVDFAKKITKKGYFVVFTTSTVTSGKILEDKLTKNIIHQYSPFQAKKYLKRFLNTWNPVVVFFVENEIFPSTINILYDKKIPFYLLNARMSDKSFKLWKMVKFYIKPLLMKYSYIFPLSKQEQYKFEFLSDKKVKIKCLGNLKFDAALVNKKIIEEKFNKKKIEGYSSYKVLLKIFKNKKIIVFGSIHSEEFEYVLKQYLEIITKINCIGIFVPRYIEESNNLEKLASKINLKPIYLNKMKIYTTKDKNLIIVNKMNVLQNLYKICDISVICGSFSSGIGGHNPIESIIFDKPTFIGPYCDKTQDLINDLLKNKIIFQTSKLSNEILNFLKNEKQNNMKLKKHIKHFFEKEENVADKIINTIKF